MKKLEIVVENGIISPEQNSKIKLFLGNNTDKKVNATFESVDNAMYWQYKYIHGYLIPDIAKAWGERDPKFILKKMFLLKDIWSLDDIPSKHGKNCIIIIDNDGAPVAYIPSLSVLSYEELNKFIGDLEHFLFIELNGHIDPKHQKDVEDIKGRI